MSAPKVSAGPHVSVGGGERRSARPDRPRSGVGSCPGSPLGSGAASRRDARAPRAGREAEPARPEDAGRRRAASEAKTELSEPRTRRSREREPTEQEPEGKRGKSPAQTHGETAQKKKEKHRPGEPGSLRAGACSPTALRALPRARAGGLPRASLLAPGQRIGGFLGWGSTQKSQPSPRAPHFQPHGSTGSPRRASLWPGLR